MIVKQQLSPAKLEVITLYIEFRVVWKNCDETRQAFRDVKDYLKCVFKTRSSCRFLTTTNWNRKEKLKSGLFVIVELSKLNFDRDKWNLVFNGSCRRNHKCFVFYLEVLVKAFCLVSTSD